MLPASGSPVLVDARTGVEAPTGLPPRSRVTTVAFARDGAAAYVIGGRGNTSELVECRGTPPRCTTVTTVSGRLAVPR